MPASLSQSKPVRREIELDFIRGIAILMVMDFHAPKAIFMAPFLWLGFRNFGWAGVDIFFVLSGFLVGGLLVKEWKQYRRIDSKRFLIRRGFKIWPQYYVFIFANLLTGHRTIHQLWGNLLNIQNYVGGIAHTWTLAVEEHAYLLLVALLAFAARRKIAIEPLFVNIGVACVVIVGWRFFLAYQGVNTFTRTDTRVDGILYGLLLAILYHYTPSVFAGLQRLRCVWCSVILAMLIFFRLSSVEVWWTAPLSCLFADLTGVSLLLLLYHHRPGRNRSAPYRLVAWVGLYSYGIYLWHISTIAFIVSFANKLTLRLATVVELIAPILFAIAIGVTMTKVVEFPALKLRDRLFPKRVDSAVDLSRSN